MSLPLLGNDFLSSPTMRGAITGKTADLLADSGAKMADRIDLLSTTAEAKSLAPGISDLYTSAYQKIASGDFTGFADMQKARSMATGNPILMKTMDEADQFAGTLAGEYTRKQMMQMQMDKTATIEQNRDSRLQTRMTQDANDKNLLAARQSYATDLSAWEKENMEAQNAYNREMQSVQNRQNGENAMAQLQGRQPQQFPMPEKPQLRPRPSLDDHLARFGVQGGGSPLPSQGLDASDNPVAGSLTGPPQASTGGLTAEPITTQQGRAMSAAAPVDAPMPTDASATPQNISLIPSQADSVYTNGSQGPSGDAPTPQPSTQPLVNQSSPQIPAAGTQLQHGTPVIRFGSLDVAVPPNKIEPKGIVYDEKTGDVKPTYEFTHDDQKLTEAISKVPPSVANFASEAHRSGEDVEFHPATPDQAAQAADKKGQFFVLRSSGGVTLTERDLDNSGNVKRDANGQALPDKPVLFDAATMKSFTDASALMKSSGLQISMPKITDPQQKEATRNFVINDLASNPDKLKKLDSANRMLQSWGVNPIAPEDIDKRLADAQQQAKSAKDATVKASQDARITADLQKRGIISPSVSDTKPAGPRDNWTVDKYNENIAANEERLKTLAETAKTGALTSGQEDEARQLQSEIHTWQDELPGAAAKAGVNAGAGAILNPMLHLF